MELIEGPAEDLRVRKRKKQFFRNVKSYCTLYSGRDLRSEDLFRESARTGMRYILSAPELFRASLLRLALATKQLSQDLNLDLVTTSDDRPLL
jgi:hypothetical protein